MDGTSRQGPTLPEEPKKEDFITKVEETIQEPVQRNEAEGSFADEPIDDSWRQIPTLEVIDGIDRMGEKKRDAIIHLYPTLGKLEDIRRSFQGSVFTFQTSCQRVWQVDR